MSENVETYGLDDERVSVTLSTRVTPNCPIKPEQDEYIVTVEWITNGETYEKWALKQYLESYNDMTVSQETLCEAVYRTLDGAAVSGLCVRVTDIKHMNMVVRKP